MATTDSMTAGNRAPVTAAGVRQARVLVVDDESTIRTALRAALELDGYHVGEAADGAAALELLGRVRCDLVVLDLNMPVLDGMSVLARLRAWADDARPAVVVLTAHGSVPAAVRAVRLGARDFLQKPVTPEELRLSVAAVLDESAPPPGVAAPAPAELCKVLAEVRRDLGRRDLAHAEQLMARVADRAGTDPAYFNLLGVLHEAEGDRRAARTFYRKAGAYPPARENLRRLWEIDTYGRTRQDAVLGDEKDLLGGMGGRVGGKDLGRVRQIMGT